MSAATPHRHPQTVLSVAGLTTYLQDLIEGDPQLQLVWVTAEVSSVHSHRSGVFFTLSDEEGAAIRAVVWTSQLPKLVQMPAVGEQLIVLGSVRVYRQRGEYQLSVWQTLPAGEGLQALRYQQLRSRLEMEGLFDPLRKRPLPSHPQIIAVVTSPSAAAWGDIQRTLLRRYPGLKILLSPALVQGEQASAAIVAAIQRIEEDGRAEVIILARGGGAVEDLSCFNDERVVRAIAECSIPIITGIGHQRDESLADLVADVSVHTPTAAAESVVPALSDLYIQHQERQQRLLTAITYRLKVEQEQVQRLKSRLKNLPVTSTTLQQAIAKCELLKQKLAALDPQAVLSRGYAILQQSDGKMIHSSENLMPAQELIIKLAAGQIKVKILEILE